MRKRACGERFNTLSRLTAVGLLGGLAAACSADTMRFAENPFSNPFGTSKAEPGLTGSLPDEAVSPPSGAVQSRPLATPATPRPATTARFNEPAATPRPAAAAAPTPKVASRAGPAGWTAQGGAAITVRDGDSLTAIVNRYGVPAPAILSANGLTQAAQVAPGRRIIIPVYNAGEAAEPVRPSVKPAVHARHPLPAAPKTAVADAADKRRHIRPGQAAERPVAAKTRIADVVKPAPQASRETQKQHLRPGQAKELAKQPAKPAPVKAAEAAKPAPAKAGEAGPRHPRPGQVAAKAPPRVESSAKAPVAARPEPPKPAPVVAKVEKPKPQAAEAPMKPHPEPKPVAKAEPPKPVKAEKVASVPPAAAPAPQPEPVKPVAAREPEQTGALHPSAGSEFRWPARGRVIAGFGGSTGNEGINLAVPEGTPVKAAEAGTIAYAGSEVKGYGNLVLIRHDNGYVSAYAHNGELMVRRGEKVKRGQVIARSGQTGNVTSPQLHFEIRKGSTPVDPTPLLASN